MIGKEDKVLPGSGIRINFNGKFNLDSLYKELKGWFDKNKYDFTEKEQTVKDKDSGKEIVVKWEAERKVDDYAKFDIRIDFFLENLNKVKEGVEGKVKITFFAKIILDYKNKFGYSKLSKLMFDIYNNLIIKGKIENVYEDKLDREVKELFNLTKEKLELFKE